VKLTVLNIIQFGEYMTVYLVLEAAVMTNQGYAVLLWPSILMSFTKLPCYKNSFMEVATALINKYSVCTVMGLLDHFVAEYGWAWGGG
jgi:hypothetical protein